jgi:YfiH family protein
MTNTWIFPDWPAAPQVHAAVTTRHGPGISLAPFDRFNLGTRSGDRADAVAANRGALQQVHGTAVAELGPLPSAVEPQADAVVSHLRGSVLAILSADCLPVLFSAEDGSEIGAAHAGWRGLAAGVLEATLGQLRVRPQRVLAWLGPCIGAASYEVGDEVRAAFVEPDGGAAAFFAPTRPGHWQCDLAALARHRLHAAGVQRIHGGGFDTCADPRFYSHRRDGARSGRFATLIWMQ